MNEDRDTKLFASLIHLADTLVAGYDVIDVADAMVATCGELLPVDAAGIMVDDQRMPLRPGETPQMKSVRFRTLGCYPLTGAVESTAATLPEIIQEMLLTTTSERQGRMIDHDQAASMEKKKQEGYF